MRNIFCEGAQGRCATSVPWSSGRRKNGQLVPLGIRHRKQKRPKASPSKKYEPLTIPQGRGGHSNSRGEPRTRNASFSQTSTVHIHGDPSSLRRARWNFLRDRED